MSLRDRAATVGKPALGRDVRWAQTIIREYRAGLYTCNYGIDLAHEVLGLERDREGEAERRALQSSTPRDFI